MNPKSKQDGFTLIGLLAVIAIIALLAALLVPALSKAKSAALTQGQHASGNTAARVAAILQRESCAVRLGNSTTFG